MRPGFVLVVLALLLLTPPAAGARPDPAAAVHSVTVTLDPDTQNAYPIENQTYLAAFSGQVTVEKLPMERMVVVLSGQVDLGWSVEISPATMVFGASSPEGFDVTVVVPPATPSSIIGRLVVTASSSGTGYSVEGSANATITIAQYFRVQVTCEAPYFETDKPNVGTTYTLRVWNKGNGPDSFELEITNLNELVDKRWAVRLDKEVTLIVQPGLYGEVILTVTPPKDQSVFESLTVAVTVKATSVQGKAQNQVMSQTFPVYFHTKAVDVVFDVTVPVIIVAVVAASVAIVVWRWRRKRARKADTAPDPEEPIDVGPD